MRSWRRNVLAVASRLASANAVMSPTACAVHVVPPSSISGRLRSRQHLAQPRHLGRTRTGLHRLVGRRVDGRRGLAQHVFGQRDHHRAGPSGSRERKRAGHQFGDAAGVVDPHHPLGHLAVHPAEIEFLERPALEEGARDLADEEDHRRRILISGVHAHARVGRARPARHEADARPAGEFAVGVGHVGGAALLPAHDEADLLARVIERVEHGEIALARHAVGRVDAVDEELIDQDLCAGARPRRAPVRENRYEPGLLPGLLSVLLSAMS